MIAGTVWGIGVGPGDPELLTVKAVRILKSVAVVAYPAPLQGPSFARAIAAPYLSDRQSEIPIRMPLLADRFPVGEVYDEAAASIDVHLKEGRDVAVLCEGDPFFYGSFMYLYGRLAAAHRVVVVPGVSSLVACPAAAGLPLAARNDALAVLPATLSEAELARKLTEADAAAIIKVGRHLGKLRGVLDALMLTPHAWLVERATLPEERVRPLAEVAEDEAPYFSMVLVHRRGTAWR